MAVYGSLTAVYGNLVQSTGCLGQPIVQSTCQSRAVYGSLGESSGSDEAVEGLWESTVV